MKREIYCEPEMQIKLFATEDVITSSGDAVTDGVGDSGNLFG